MPHSSLYRIYAMFMLMIYEYVYAYGFLLKCAYICSSHLLAHMPWDKVFRCGAQWGTFYNVSTYSCDNYNNDVWGERGMG